MDIITEGGGLAARVVPEYALCTIVTVGSVIVLPRTRSGRAPLALIWINLTVVTMVSVSVAARSGVQLDNGLVDAFRWEGVAAVAVAALAFGVLPSLAVLTGALSVVLIMVEVSPNPPVNTPSYIVQKVVELIVVVVAVHTIRTLLTRFTASGRMEGRLIAQRQMLRMMHDTALQALEAIAIMAMDDENAESALAQIRNQAVKESTALRHLLNGGSASDDAGDVLAGLQRLVEDYEARGLIVDLVCTDVDGIRLPPDLREALVGAAGEALANVLKHSRAEVAVVGVRCEGPDLVVSIRDHGVGFDPTVRTGGFGLAASILARLSDVGGVADVWSCQGEGTRVTLRLPTRVATTREMVTA
jgi:signal transduction histidine kinase